MPRVRVLVRAQAVKQRGFGLMELGLALGILIALGVLYGMYKSELTRADKAGYDRALKEVAKRDKKELEDAQALIAGLTLEKETQAALHAAEQAGKKNAHDKELANAKRETADLLHRIDTGSLVLRDPGRAWKGGAGVLNPDGNSGRSPLGAATTAAGGSGQAQPEGLSPTLTRFLVVEADRADEVAADLELCWGIAKDDRTRLKP